MFWRKAFTLIEILITVGLLGVVAAGVVTLMDPVDKYRQGTDAKVQHDIAQIATAMQSYAVANDGLYPVSFDLIVSSGELVTFPTPPVAYDCAGGAGIQRYGDSGAYAVDNTVNPPTASVRCQLLSKKYVGAGKGEWAWCSGTGRAGAVVPGGCP